MRPLVALIEKIHASDTFAVILETGCGVPLAANLLGVPGASKTVYLTESPYAQTYAHTAYHNAATRAVSPEYVRTMLFSPRWDSAPGVNTVYAASFQVGNHNENHVSTHGWIGLRYKETALYYHVSLHAPRSRENYIKIIGEIGVKLLAGCNAGVFEHSGVDIVLNADLTPRLDLTLRFIAAARATEQMCVITQEGIDRIETVTRTVKELVIYKGSFNPVQNAHVAATEYAQGLYPDSKVYFCLSTSIFSKGRQGVESLMLRIKMLRQLGYDVLVSSEPLFKRNHAFLRQKYQGKIVFVMGLDTIERLVDDYQGDTRELLDDFSNTEFALINRSGDPARLASYQDYPTAIQVLTESPYLDYSSTQVREAVKAGDFATIRQMVPTTIYDAVVSNY